MYTVRSFELLVYISLQLLEDSLPLFEHSPTLFEHRLPLFLVISVAQATVAHWKLEKLPFVFDEKKCHESWTELNPGSMEFFPSEFCLSSFIRSCARAVASGGASGARPPHLKSVPPFHIWPPGCYMNPIMYFKNVSPPSGFWPPCW